MKASLLRLAFFLELFQELSSMESLTKEFSNNTDSDVIVYYSRTLNGKNSELDDKDMKVMTDLLSYYCKKDKKDNLNLILHTKGGNIFSAIGLIRLFRSRYKSIKTFIPSVAKSSGAFIALAADECYMQKDAVISDFSIDFSQKINSSVQVAYGEIASLIFQGLCASVKRDYFNKRLAFNPVHAEEIDRPEAIAKIGIKKISDYEFNTEVVGHLHNKLMDKLDDNSHIDKMYGINGEYFFL